MVIDHRSGRGKVNGGPPHLPVPPGGALRVSEDDRQLLAAAFEAAAASRAAADQAQAQAATDLAGRAFAIKHLWRKYRLAESDAVDWKTGEIKRGGADRADG